MSKKKAENHIINISTAGASPIVGCNHRSIRTLTKEEVEKWKRIEYDVTNYERVSKSLSKYQKKYDIQLDNPGNSTRRLKALYKHGDEVYSAQERFRDSAHEDIPFLFRILCH